MIWKNHTYSPIHLPSEAVTLQHFVIVGIDVAEGKQCPSKREVCIVAIHSIHHYHSFMSTNKKLSEVNSFTGIHIIHLTRFCNKTKPYAHTLHVHMSLYLVNRLLFLQCLTTIITTRTNNRAILQTIRRQESNHPKRTCLVTILTDTQWHFSSKLFP